MKRALALALSLLLLGGCAAGGESSSSSVSLLTGETVSGIITKVNGNEITLDLVTLGQSAPREEGMEAPSGETPVPGESGEAPSGEMPAPNENRGAPASGEGEAQRGERPSDGSRGDRQAAGGEGRGGPSDGGEMEPPSGEAPGGSPSFGGAGTSGGNQKGYTRTGETALYQIPVGASVLTLTGTSRGFNSLSTDLLVTITFREDGVTPGQVQVIQSLS